MQSAGRQKDVIEVALGLRSRNYEVKKWALSKIRSENANQMRRRDAIALQLLHKLAHYAIITRESKRRK